MKENEKTVMQQDGVSKEDYVLYLQKKIDIFLDYIDSIKILSSIEHLNELILVGLHNDINTDETLVCSHCFINEACDNCLSKVKRLDDEFLSRNSAD